MSLLHLVERSITAEGLVAELDSPNWTTPSPQHAGPPKQRMDYGPELISPALQQFCAGRVGLSYIPLDTAWNNGYIDTFNNRLNGRFTYPGSPPVPLRR